MGFQKGYTTGMFCTYSIHIRAERKLKHLSLENIPKSCRRRMVQGLQYPTAVKHWCLGAGTVEV
jgi:hypothetical protein